MLKKAYLLALKRSTQWWLQFLEVCPLSPFIHIHANKVKHRYVYEANYGGFNSARGRVAVFCDPTVPLSTQV